MKNWIVNYAVRYKDGSTEDYKTDFQAATIRDALEMTERFVAELRANDGIDRIVIWDIGIVEMDPF